MSEAMQSESIGKLAAALSKAQAEMNGVAKTSANPFFNSKYADLHGCLEAAREPLANNGLAVVQTMAPAEGKAVGIITTLVHSSGEWIRGKIEMQPKKNDDQGYGSSITYGRRYSFAAIVGLAQKDDDGNASCQQQNGAQQKKFDEAIRVINTYCDNSLEYFQKKKPDMLKAAAAYPPEMKAKLEREIKNVEQVLTEGK